MLSAWLPLKCVLCDKPPRQLCDHCRAQLPLRKRSVSRAGAPPGFSCADYSESVATLVKAFKNDGSVILARQLGVWMAAAVGDWARQTRTDRQLEIALVPAPSRAANNRSRGYSPARLLASNLAVQLRALGVNARVCDLMKVSGPVRDQADLNRSERKLNLVGRMSIEGSAHSRLANRKVVLVDDIITTGSTVAEMARCLESEGIVPEIFITFAETL